MLVRVPTLLAREASNLLAQPRVRDPGEAVAHRADEEALAVREDEVHAVEEVRGGRQTCHPMARDRGFEAEPRVAYRDRVARAGDENSLHQARRIARPGLGPGVPCQRPERKRQTRIEAFTT